MPVAASLVALLGGLAWLYSSGSEGASASAASVETPREREQPPSVNAGAPSESVRTALEANVSTAPIESPIALVAGSRTGEPRGRVVDEAGKTIAAARVSLQRGEARDFTVLDLELNEATELVAETASDARTACTA